VAAERRQGKILPAVVLLFRAETKSGNVMLETAAEAEAAEAEVVSPIVATIRGDQKIL
jgi:hypothetical protein